MNLSPGGHAGQRLAIEFILRASSCLEESTVGARQTFSVPRDSKWSPCGEKAHESDQGQECIRITVYPSNPTVLIPN